jgi:hypothetical protein
MLLTLIPTLLMCTFLVLAAPYLKPIVMRVLNVEKDYLILNVELAEDKELVAPVTPPPNPDLANAAFYQKLYDGQGFDWRNPPKLEIPEIEYTEIQKEIKPVEVELSLMLNVPLALSENHQRSRFCLVVCRNEKGRIYRFVLRVFKALWVG